VPRGRFGLALEPVFLRDLVIASLSDLVISSSLCLSAFIKRRWLMEESLPARENPAIGRIGFLHTDICTFFGPL
jgi:hypothetical protein